MKIYDVVYRFAKEFCYFWFLPLQNCLKLENRNIIIVSNEEWGDTWFSKHNYAWELSKKNKVIFLNPPRPFAAGNWFRKNISEKIITEKLSVLTYSNLLPVRIEFLRLLNEKFVFSFLLNFLTKNKFNEIIFWTFDPIRLSSPEKLRPSFIILHAVDRHRFKWKSEKILAEKANVIFCVAEEIASDFSSFGGKVIVLPHAIASDEIIESRKARNNKIKGVFVGNLDKRIDFETTSYLISKFPEVEFHFVGKIAPNCLANTLIFSKNFPNVYYHGEKPFKQLKDYISMADFCFLFKDNNLNGNNISSHKMLQYFAQGKPMFVTGLTKYNDVKHLLYMSNNRNKLEEMLRNFIHTGEPEYLATERIDYARKHSFENILLKIELILKNA